MLRARQRRSKRRGYAAVETLWITVAFSIPLFLMFSAWGVEQLAQYKIARSYMLQSFP